MDFGTLLHLVVEPFLDFMGAMKVKDARTKAKYGSLLAARVAVAHQLRYPPIVLKGVSGESESVVYKFSAGFKNFKTFTGTHNTGTKHEILKNLKTIKGNMQKVINWAFPPRRNPTIHAIFEDTLSIASDQVKEWIDSIRDFQDTMVEAGIDNGTAWESNCVYIKCLFDDLHDVKSNADEGADDATIIWGGMCAPRVVSEYRKYNWIEHPSVGSMLVLTVIEKQDDDAGLELAQKGLSRADDALDKLKTLKSEMQVFKRELAKKQDK